MDLRKTAGIAGANRTEAWQCRLPKALQWRRVVAFCLGVLFLFAVSTAWSIAQEPATADGTTDGTTPPRQPAGTESSAAPPSQTLLKGQIQYLVPRGTALKLKLASVPTSAMKMLDRDMEGNLLPAQVGQQITAKIVEDLYVDDNKVIPEGTVFYGEVSKIHPQRRVGRPGHLEISFNRLITPDGRRFAFHAEADNFKPSTPKSKLRGFGIIAAHAAGGAIVGALVAYQLFGWQATAEMHGYNIAGGAAGGALLATGFAIMRKGPKATLEPGDDLNMAIDCDLLMPIAVDPSEKKKMESLRGFDISIEKSKTKRDGLGGYLRILELSIDNNTSRRFKSIDLFLEDSNGNKHPLIGGELSDSEFIFTIEPHSIQRVNVSFRVEFPKLKYHLVWLDHKTRLVCHRLPLPN